MSDYATVQDVKARLVGPFGADQALGGGQTRDGYLQTLVTTCSRRFDLQTGRVTNYWAAATGITRTYSGSGTQFQDIDDWTLVTGVTMSTKQDRSDVKTLLLTYDPTDPGDYVVVLPTNGPPFNRLFLLRGWLPDVYQIQNVSVTGNVETPAAIADAVAIWAAYEFRRSQAGWQDRAVHGPGGPTSGYGGQLPTEVQSVIDFYANNRLGPKLSLEDGTDRRRQSRWLGWIST